jgi:hypothetical protein
MRRDRVQEGERYVTVAIVIAGLDEDGKFEGAAALRGRVGGKSCAARRAQRMRKNGSRKDSRITQRRFEMLCHD